jgi:hypothetical protein
MHREELNIKKGIDSYHLLYEPVKNIKLTIDTLEVPYKELDNLYVKDNTKAYSLQHQELLLGFAPEVDAKAQIIYKHFKVLRDEKCFIELPQKHLEALRLLFMSKIHEKPTRNTKERNLSVHYLNLYERELKSLRIDKKTRAKNIRTKYQII